MTGVLWWRRLVNSVRFLDDIEDALTEERSVLLLFDTDIPWQDIMIETIEGRLNDRIDSRTFDVFDVSKVESPGTYLLERYCSKEERNKYWPTTHGSPENFLAQNRVTPLNKRFVCLRGIQPQKAAEWVSSITEYLENCDVSKEHGVFLLIAEGTGTAVSKQLTAFRHNDYVTDYDCMMLCLTMVSDLSCSRSEKMYLCEVASNIARNCVELAALLVSEKLALLQDPAAVTERVYRENGIKVTNLQGTVRVAVWEAQIKLVFPKLEDFRAGIIRKYEAKLQKFMPIRSSNNDTIDKAADLEIGQLFYVCKENRASKITDYAEFEMIRKMRDARNTLAHREILSYAQLKDIGMI
ncbi:MAG: hypothetical protein K6F80_04850 [Oscillospiraceae bacterium]|nr:hypothetical protein [Oscillospiraceae bacterium]